MLLLIYFPNEVIVFAPFTGSLNVQRKQGLFFCHRFILLLKNAVYFIMLVLDHFKAFGKCIHLPLWFMIFVGSVFFSSPQRRYSLCKV